MPNIIDTLPVVNGDANNVPVDWSQHERLFISFNMENDDGTARDVTGYTFTVGACMITVEFGDDDDPKRITSFSELLVPQPTFNPPTIADSPRLGQKYLDIPADLYLGEVQYNATTRPAVVADVLSTNPMGETELIRFTIVVYKAKGS